MTANYSTIFYDYNLTTRFLLRPIFALYLTFRHGRQTLMDSYNFVSPMIGIASFFTDLVKFLADERRIKLFTAIDFFKSFELEKENEEGGGREWGRSYGNRSRFSPGLKLMVNWPLIFERVYHHSEEIRETREIKRLEKSIGKSFFHVTIDPRGQNCLHLQTHRSFIISNCYYNIRFLLFYFF